MNRFGQEIFREKKSLNKCVKIQSSRLALFRMRAQLAEIDPLLETLIPVCETDEMGIAGSLDDVILGSHSAIFRRDHLELGSRALRVA